MTDVTARLTLPLLIPGQAQKDMTHNEALALLTIAVQASVVDVGIDTPPTDPQPGDCWIVGTAPVGAWIDHPDAVAGWTAGGWRFVPPHDGFAAHVTTGGRRATYRDGTWRIDTPVPAIPAPVGGDVVDTQARTAIERLIATLEAFRMVVK